MKTARILTVVTLAVALLGALLITGWAVLAQAGDPQPPPDEGQASGVVLDAATLEAAKSMPVRQAAETLEPLRQQARQAMAAGQYDWAANLFLEFTTHMPMSPERADSVLAAADAYAKSGRTADARQMYDRAASAARELFVVPRPDEFAQQTARTIKPAAKEILRRALKAKAELCQASGDSQGALTTIQQFRAEDPEFAYLRELLPLQAELQGVDPAALHVAESEASRLSDQAKWAWKEGDSGRAYQLVDTLVAQYPDSAAAMLAKRLKVRMLWRHKRYPEAKALCQEIVDRLQTLAPTCDLVREASANLSWLESIRAVKDLHARTWRKQPITTEEWEQVRDHCRTVMKWDQERQNRATMHIQLVESFAWEGRDADVVEEVGRLLQSYDSAQNMEKPALKRILMWARLFRGRAMKNLRQYQEAQEAIQETIAAYQDDPKGWELGGPLPSAYYSLWQVLRASGSTPEQCRAAVQPLFEKMPRSQYVMRILNPRN